METISPAAQVIISIIPIVGIFFGGIIIFFYLLWQHYQICLSIKTGNFKPVHYNLKLISLLAGLLLAGVGFVLSILFLLLNGLSYALLGGLIPFALGISLIVFYKLYPNG
ncbi:MAG: hypothetical protein NC041_09665 [Bacteroides sp.]|nr:hypothetical protein [Prevotella sp.]MCM1408644.1 hypothetical protein [Treponema brennaborense]MCM1470718.1 hypothetical protein [Bacteroides sp.]